MIKKENSRSNSAIDVNSNPLSSKKTREQLNNIDTKES